MYYYKEENSQEYEEISIEEIIEGFNNNHLREEYLYDKSSGDFNNISLSQVIIIESIPIEKFIIPIQIDYYFSLLKYQYNPKYRYEDMQRASPKGKISDTCRQGLRDCMGWDDLGIDNLNKFEDILIKSKLNFDLRGKNIKSPEIQSMARQGILNCENGLNLIKTIKDLRVKD